MTDGKDNDRSESDVESDPKVVASRAGKHGDGDGSSVGQSNSDDDFDAGETGAEARSQ